MAWQQIEMSEDELAEVDRWIYRLARGHGRLRLRVGQALTKNDESQHHEYGFSSFGAYTMERLSVTGRWAADSRALARRLEALPRIRAGLEEGRIGWCMAEVLARDATAESEEAFLAEASGETIRTMRERLRARRPEEAKLAPPPETAAEEQGRPLTAPEALMRDPLARELGIVVDDLGVVASDSGVEEDDPMHMLAVTGPVEEQWLLEVTRMAVEQVTGCEAPGAWVEPLLAEGFGAILPWFPGADPISGEMRARRELARRTRALLEERRARAEALAAPSVVAQREVEAGDAPGEDDPIPEDPWVRERRVRQWCAELASRDVWLGKHLSRFFAADGWRRLGYASETQYAQERLGMSRASMRKHMRLARQSEHLDRLSEAVGKGEVGYEAALALLRVVGPDTEEAWVERARKRTHKHLREELVMVETLARMTKSDLRDATPPTDEEMEAWFGLEREAVTGRLYQRALERVGLAAASEGSTQVSGVAPTPGEEASGRVCAAGEMGGCDAAARRLVQMSGEDPSERAGRSDEVGGRDATSVPLVQMSGGEHAAVIEAGAADGASGAHGASRHRGTVTR